MHILVANDDGPPSQLSSPYVLPLVRELQRAGHVVSVCLPDSQRSWIGKAHIYGMSLTPTYYTPPRETFGADQGTVHSRPLPPVRRQDGEVEEIEQWVLVNGTPASAVQIGLYHYFRERGPVDLVLSGPNYGRNTTACFALSSGTLGAALEGATCRVKAVALSFAFFRDMHEPAVIAQACRQGVRVMDALLRQWPDDGSVDLYSVNVPLVDGVEANKVVFAEILQNYWCGVSTYEAVDADTQDVDTGREEAKIRAGGKAVVGRDDARERALELQDQKRKGTGLTHRHFKWAPDLRDVFESVRKSRPGNDGWAVEAGYTSITPLRANFWHAATDKLGKELKLSETPTQPRHGDDLPDNGSNVASAVLPTTMRREADTITEEKNKTEMDVEEPKERENEEPIYAVVAYEDDYVQPLIVSALESLLPPSRLRLAIPPPSYSLADLLPDPDARVVQVAAYESLDFAFAAAHPATAMVNSYVFRKALIRKHFLSATVDHWVAKHPRSVLRSHVKRSEAFELDYAEFLDDALVEAFDLRESLDRNAGTHANGDGTAALPADREWWILKPGMSDRGHGIRLFSTTDELRAIFDGWEVDQPNSDDDDDGDGDDDDDDDDGDDDGGAGSADIEQKVDKPRADSYGITTSHLRHFVAQPYIHPPLLLPGSVRKFHVRAYVLCVGRMRVFVYRPMLALAAGKPYSAPWESGEEGAAVDMDVHLTNTCLQSPEAREDASAVQRFWDLDLGSVAWGGGATDGRDRGREQGQGQQMTEGTGGGADGGEELKRHIFAQVCAVTGEVFEAAARGMAVHFQPLANGFEAYGLDFLVDDKGTAWLLEVNAFPDFRQTGSAPGLRGLVAGFWRSAVRWAVGGFFGVGWEEGGRGEGGEGGEVREEDGEMVLVREVSLGRV